MQRAREIEWSIDHSVAERLNPSARQRFADADSALASVEAIDAFWPEPTIERSRLAYMRAWAWVRGGLPDNDSSYLRQLRDGVSHAERAVNAAPNDPEALAARGSLHYWQWLLNLAPNSTAAAALLRSADEDLTKATTANKRLASGWNVLSHLRLNQGQTREAAIAAENALMADPYLPDVSDRTIYRLFASLLDLQYADDARKWCAIGNARFPQDYRFTECRLWVAALPAASKPNVSELWNYYELYLKLVPADRLAYYRLKGKLIMALALTRAGQPDSARALALVSQGDSTIDPDGDLRYLAAVVYAQAGDNDAAFDVLGKLISRSAYRRKQAAEDKTWWWKDLRSDPRYQALLRQSH